MTHEERDQLMDDLLENNITEADFLRLEASLIIDPSVRRAYYQRVGLTLTLQTESREAPRPVHLPIPLTQRRWWPTALAGAAALLAAAATFALFQAAPATPTAPIAKVSESQASGFAVLVSQAGTQWQDRPLADGAVIPAQPIVLHSGIAHIEFFSGVTLVVEGAAAFEVISPMEMKLTHGKMRAHVPEPAQGFKIRTAEGDLVDLGTEFGINVSPGQSEVHVLTGEVEWHPHKDPMRRMLKGEAARWNNTTTSPQVLTAKPEDFTSLTQARQRITQARKASRDTWKNHHATTCRDPRLIACYQPSSVDQWSRQFPNLATTAEPKPGDAAIVAATRDLDRWGTPQGGLDLSPTGSRIRLTIPGDYRSLTLLAWVKINSLDRLYNSLFLTDGHEVGEPHWQLTDDGRLFFSVKKLNPTEPTGQDKHHFYSPPFWNTALSGQWLMLATTYDVDAHTVTHYLNGQPINTESIPPAFLVEKVTLGDASIGNWSQPQYHQDPRFAVRNLNGTMDEFALYSAALTPTEIAQLHSLGRP